MELEELLRISPPVRDIEKLKMKLEKLVVQQRHYEQEYHLAVERNFDIHQQWIRDTAQALSEFEKLDQDRFNFLRGSMWKYANSMSQTCVLNDESSERIRLALENANFEQDLILFVQEHQTGSQIPEPMPFEPFRSSIKHQSVESISENNSEMPHINHKVYQFQFEQEKPKLKHQKSLILEKSLADSTFYDPFDIQNFQVQFTMRAIYDYQATCREELSLKQGQLLKVVLTHEDGWFEAITLEDGRERKGLFPSNFCEPA